MTSDINLFDFSLPPSLIAQFPVAERTASRLLSVSPDGSISTESHFAEICNLLRPGDLLVANNTRVVPARLIAYKPTGGRVEIMLERILTENTALVQLRSNKSISSGQALVVDKIIVRVTQRSGKFFIIQSDPGEVLLTLFQKHGVTPLPPYIKREAGPVDLERYQTVYASTDGAVAAPTAGLHFDQALIDKLIQSGIHWASITLHVGAGTFQPMRTASVDAHHMHREWVVVDRQTCDQIDHVRATGGRIIAVGTTVVRALESAAQFGLSNQLQPFCGDTELFILPGYRFRVVDALITNFHLPRSTLLMLVCAFSGHSKIMRAYRYAIEHQFRFYSYGDAMFVEREAD